jgi:hypothetical protein
MAMTFAYALYLVLVLEIIAVILLAVPLSFVSKPVANLLKSIQKPLLILLLCLTVVVGGTIRNVQRSKKGFLWYHRLHAGNAKVPATI